MPSLETQEAGEARRPAAAGPLPTLLIGVHDVAALLGCSTRHVRRLHVDGDMPACVRVGRLVRWNRKQIEDWIASGCPAGGR